MSVSLYRGVYWPNDLDKLQRVFDRLCAERRLAKKDQKIWLWKSSEFLTTASLGRALSKRSRA